MPRGKRALSSRAMPADDVLKVVDTASKAAQALILRSGRKAIAAKAQRIYQLCQDMEDDIAEENNASE